MSYEFHVKKKQNYGEFLGQANNKHIFALWKQREGSVGEGGLFLIS